MKKILVLLFLFFSFLAGFSQTGNDTTKYTYYKYTYGNRLQRYWADSVMVPPKDTTYSKYGIAIKSGNFYFGNGTYWQRCGVVSSDTIYVTQIGTGSPQIPLVYAVNGNLRVARLVPELYTIPIMNADSGVGIRVDTTMLATWLKIVAQYGPPSGLGIIPTIYNSNGRFNGARYINVAGNSLLWDSVVNPTTALTDAGFNASRWTLVDSGRDIFMQIGQATTSGGGLKQGFQIDVGGVRSGGLSGGANPYSSFILDSNYTDITDQFGNYFLMAAPGFGQPGITIHPAGGAFTIYNLPTTNDSAYKPIAQLGAFGPFVQLDHWPGSGGGSSGYSVTTAANTANYTVPSGRDIAVILSDLTGQANRNVVLPGSPTTGDKALFRNINGAASTFNWTFTVGTVKDGQNNSITTLDNKTTYKLWFDGTNWNIEN